MDIFEGLRKIVDIFEQEKISYMIVGGLATSYYNKYRFTSDIDLVVGMYPHNIDLLVKHFPDWLPFLEGFKENAARGIVFNLTDFETGVKYDFMLYEDSDYNWRAFERRQKVSLSDIECYISTPEDLIISKLIWYSMSDSTKQLKDLKFLLALEGLNMQYLEIWATKLNINRYGLF
ncbi:MAG: DUF6036 family nucleotidyltransferase [Chitinophagales bacterium]